jgi:hypothetical protein
MQEFRIDKDALKREERWSVLSWGIVALLFAIAVALFVFHISGYMDDSPNLGGVFVLTILVAAILAVILAPREGLRRAERKMVFSLDDSRIVRKRPGFPDVKIAFSEIDILSEDLRWLVVISAEPRKKIAIPKNICGYDLVRTELAKHHPLSRRAALPLKGTVLLTVSVLSWIALLWFRDVKAMATAGTVAVATLVFGSYRVLALLHKRSNLPLLWAYLGFAWLAALSLIFIRVVHPY